MFVFVCALIVTTFIDLEFQIIPDEISVGGMLLGLAVSYMIVDGMGGSIAAQSQIDMGATFTIELPLCGAETNAKQNQPD